MRFQCTLKLGVCTDCGYYNIPVVRFFVFRSLLRGDTNNMTKKYLSAASASKETGIAEFRIRTWIKEKKIPGFQAGKKFLINMEAFEIMLESLCNENVQTK